MSSITKSAKGYRAQISVKGVRDSSSFRTKREAAAWASARELEILENLSKAPKELHTLEEALIRYRDTVSPTKRSVHWEVSRINTMLKGSLPIKLPIGEITPDVVGRWRDKRLEGHATGSVLRELGQLSTVFNEAVREWGWTDTNPVKQIRKPPPPAHRTTVISKAEIKGMLKALKYKAGSIRSVNNAVAVAFLLALRTGMRAGELCGLTWDRVTDEGCYLPVTKTVPRVVPLSKKARRLVEMMRGVDDEYVIGVTTQTLDALFRKARAKAGLEGFTFHDSRLTAATWIAHKIHILDLCKMFGWARTTQALTYYNPKASDIAAKLDQRVDLSNRDKAEGVKGQRPGSNHSSDSDSGQ